MQLRRMVNVVGVHTCGERNDVITGGVADVPGASVFEKMQFLETQSDDLRKFLLQEPRGSVTQCVNLVLPACHPEADIGFVIMESDFYVPMSGSNTICTVTAILETGILPMQEPVTEFTLEAPGGLVRIKAECRDGKCVNVRFENVASFVFGLDVPVDVPGLGQIKVDVAYGGMIYAVVDAAELGFKLVPEEAAQLVEVGERIKRAAAVQAPAVHPENPGIHTINQTLFANPLTQTEEGWEGSNAVIVSPGRLDRSPCGTGTSARLAVLAERGLIEPGQKLRHRGILGTEYIGEHVGWVDIGGKRGIRPAITGSAWITGFHQYVLDGTDPLPTGYRLNDLWRD
ncbi:proline racemase family protein [Croceicoccus bisphenolivorans]|uniref:proline racemase family protein n=1 Tax=Croceicoccus bisphenolivorans TaxID=1783232 RepID=UPI00082EEE51|nr:proline racemase family protein [Croceicoccus bisphenolivorans]